jgi:uncharacterized protein (TIGR02466 family)
MIENLFPVKIYKTKYTSNFDELRNVILPKLESVFNATVSNNQGSMRGGLCSYNVVRDLHLWPELYPYVNFLNAHLPVYWKELGYNSMIPPKIFEMWANKYTPHSFIDTHNHSPIPITISFYLQTNKDSGNIVFEHPNSTLLKHQPVHGLDDRNTYHTLFDHEIDIEEGDIIMFPGWLKHKTTPNVSKNDRIMIGANVVAYNFG